MISSELLHVTPITKTNQYLKHLQILLFVIMIYKLIRNLLTCITDKLILVACDSDVVIKDFRIKYRRMIIYDISEYFHKIYRHSLTSEH